MVVILIIFPGLIFRRLFFYGEFSKEFRAGHNLIGLLAISTVPGIIILAFTFIAYHYTADWWDTDRYSTGTIKFHVWEKHN